MNHEQKEFAKFAARQSEPWVRPSEIALRMREALRIMDDSFVLGGMGNLQFEYSVERYPGGLSVTQKERVLHIGGAMVTFKSPYHFALGRVRRK